MGEEGRAWGRPVLRRSWGEERRASGRLTERLGSRVSAFTMMGEGLAWGRWKRHRQSYTRLHCVHIHPSLALDALPCFFLPPPLKSQHVDLFICSLLRVGAPDLRGAAPPPGSNWLAKLDSTEHNGASGLAQYNPLQIFRGRHIILPSTICSTYFLGLRQAQYQDLCNGRCPNWCQQLNPHNRASYLCSSQHLPPYLPHIIGKVKDP